MPWSPLTWLLLPGLKWPVLHSLSHFGGDAQICSQKFMEKAMAPHSSTLALKIPWREEPDRLQSRGSRRVRHDWATSLSVFPFMHWRRKWQPTPVFLPGESQGQRSLVGCSPWGCWSQTQLKWLSSNRSSSQKFTASHLIYYPAWKIKPLPHKS